VNSSTICAGSSTTLTANGVTTYTWSTGSNASSISVSPASTTIYTVSGNLTGCATQASQTTTVNVNVCTGITEIDNTSVAVYPNPAKDLITITVNSSSIGHATIEMYDAIGKLVIAEKVNNTDTGISLAGFANGMYTIRVVSENNQSII
jgi:hypothetical protein